MSTCFDNPVIRDGTSQQMRLIKALQPEYALVDDRNFTELKQFVRAFAKEIRYFAPDGSTNNNWEVFFDKELNDEQLTDPHYALFQAFLELFKIVQTDLNMITKRHLDFFYKEVLGLREKSPVSDQVFMIFELAKHVSETGHLMEEGTRLKAGKDALGNPVSYGTFQDVVINKAVVADIKSIFKDPGTSRLYSSPIAKSEDGQGAAIESDAGSWLPFGNKTRTPAEIGYALSSPILHLAEGTRTVTIKLKFKEPGDLLKLIETTFLEDAFNVYFSGKKEWISPLSKETLSGLEKYGNLLEARTLQYINKCQSCEEIAGMEPTEGPVYDSPTSGYGDQYRDYDIGWKVAERILEKRTALPGGQFSHLDQIKEVKGVGVDKINDLLFSMSHTFHSTTIDLSNDTLCLVRTLGKDQKAIVGYNEEKLLDPFQTSLPVVKIILNNENDNYLYDQLIDLKLESVQILVDVSEVRNLVVQNDQTTMDPAKTVQPFGIVPVLGSNFYIGSQEVFQKQLDYLKLNINWHGLPTETGEDESGNILNGFDYHYFEYITKRTNTSFKSNISILDKKNWVSLAEANLVADNDNTTLNELREIELLNNTALQKIERDPDLEEIEKLDTDTKKGFIRLELSGLDFGNKDYQPSFTRKVLKSLEADPDTVNFPKEPYTPAITAIWIDYQSQVTIELDKKEEEQVEKYFHITPFGVADRSNEEAVVYFLPQFKNEGEIYIGLEKFVPPQTLSLLMQILEGSEDPTVAKPAIDWAYMSGNEWILFEQFDILADSTNGLLTSGILNFSVSESATDENTILPVGYHWLRASVTEGSRAIPAFIDLKAQAVLAEYENNDNDPEYLSEALPAESISKLVESDSAIKTITQPFASFGGKVAEQSTAFYTRISERLRHKQRAITIWDYERLALEEFSSIYKIKCLNHTKYTGTKDSFSGVAPGHVTLTVVSNVQNKNSVDLIRPLTSLNTLQEIKSYLDQYNATAITLHVQNPIYEEIRTNFKVKFKQGYDIGYYKRQLEDEIKAFLAPWAYSNSPDIVFGGKIHQSTIIDFIDEREYVDYVTCFKMFHLNISSIVPVTEAIATTSASILCSIGRVSTYGDHLIEVLETEDNCDTCDDNIVLPPPTISSPDDCGCPDESPQPAEPHDPYDYSHPDLTVCRQPEEVDDCSEEKLEDLSTRIKDLDKSEFYDTGDPQKVYLKQVNLTYLLPVSTYRVVKVEVIKVLDKRSVKVQGDLSRQLHDSIEYPYGKKPQVFDIKTPIESDGTTSTIHVLKKNHPINAGERLNVFRRTPPQFREVYLPHVSQQMVDTNARIRIQLVTGTDEKVEIFRADKSGQDRLKFQSNSTTEKSILLGAKGNPLLSVELIAEKFEPLDGYNDYGWSVIDKNTNYYQRCVEASCNDDWDDRIEEERMECVLTDAENETYFEKIDDGDDDHFHAAIKKVNITYLLPASVYRTVNTEVVEVLDSKSLIIGSELHEFNHISRRRLENVYRFTSKPVSRHINAVFDPANGQTKIRLKSNNNNRFKVGDRVNVFREEGNQFHRVYLPKVTQQMVDQEAMLNIQIVAIDDDQEIAVYRAERNGKDRLQPLGSSSTTIKKIKLSENLYSVSLKAREFSPESGFNRFGWEVIEKDVNYYRRCIEEDDTSNWDNNYSEIQDDD